MDNTYFELGYSLTPLLTVHWTVQFLT